MKKIDYYVLLKSYALSLEILENDLIADEVILYSESKRLPSRKSRLDFFEEKVKQAKHLSKFKKEEYLFSISMLRRRRFRLVEAWKYIVKEFLDLFKKIDQSDTLIIEAYHKIEQAIDNFKGKIAVLKRRLKTDMVRIKNKFMKIFFTSFDENPSSRSNNFVYTEESLYSQSCKCSINYHYPSPEEICMARGL